MDVITQRLRLRPLDVDTAAAVVAGDRAGQPWSPGYPTEGDLDIARMVLAAPAEPVGVFGPRQVVLRASGLAVGGIGFFGPPDQRGVLSCGYGLAPEVRRQGLATEALRALLSLARDDPRALLVRADTLPGNVASQGVLTRTGFSCDGRDGRDDEHLHWSLRLR